MSISGGKQAPKNRTYTVEDIAAILGIGKSSAYKLANSGEFQTIRIGNMIRVAGDDYPAEVVKSRFLKLNSSHIEYVLDRMRENTTYVRNIKKYLLAALYNAPATIDSYYASLVNHDLYGSGERR